MDTVNIRRNTVYIRTNTVYIRMNTVYIRTLYYISPRILFRIIGLKRLSKTEFMV